MRSERDSVTEVEAALAAVAPSRGAVVVRWEDPVTLLRVQVRERQTAHVRHEEKHTEADLPEHVCFYSLDVRTARAAGASSAEFTTS